MLQICFKLIYTDLLETGAIIAHYDIIIVHKVKFRSL